MTINSLDQVLSKVTTNRTFTSHFTHNFLARSISDPVSYDHTGNRSSGPPNSFSGTALTWTPCDETTGNGTEIFGLPHGGNTSPDTKHLLNIFLDHGTAPGNYILIDLQGYWPGINTSVTSTQTLSGTPGSNLRYTNGVGCQLYAVQTLTAGAAVANLSLSYTNQAGTTGRGLLNPPVSTASRANNTLTFSGSSSNSYPFFFPLAAGDTGVQNVASVTLSANITGGTMALCLARPLAYLTFQGTSSVPAMTLQKNYLTSFPSLPEIKDNACLTFLYRSSGFTLQANLTGNMSFVW